MGTLAVSKKKAMPRLKLAPATNTVVVVYLTGWAEVLFDGEWAGR